MISRYTSPPKRIAIQPDGRIDLWHELTVRTARSPASAARERSGLRAVWYISRVPPYTRPVRALKHISLGLAALVAFAAGAHAQDSASTRATSTPATAALAAPLAPADTVAHDTTAADSTRAATLRAQSRSRRRFRTNLAIGFVTSILAHETGHVVAALAEGGHPSFGFNKLRPTIYSGIDAHLHPTKQFIFSSAGLTVQSLLDEAILDVPHRGGSAFERGVLAGGIGTAFFYITIGRNGPVSDVAYMARTSKLSKDQVSLIYGGIAALQMVRIHGMAKYAHFFTAPDDRGGVKIGVRIDGDLGQ